MKIIVLAGGLSPERDVSLCSASKIAKGLINQGHKICILDLCKGISFIDDILTFISSIEDIPDFNVSEKPMSIKQTNEQCQIGQNVIESCKKADIVFIALHGDIGENGKVQSLLDMYSIKYTGSGYEGCMLSMDKALSKTIVQSQNINTPKWSINNKSDDLAFPCVVKPSNGGSSIGISIVNNDKELELAINSAKEFDKKIIVEEKIDGREFSVGILNDKPLPIIEIIPKSGFYDYKNKYQPDMTKEICPAELSDNIAEFIQQTALKIHNALNLKFYSRIDFILDCKNNLYFLEANSLPGMTPTSLLPQEAAAVGISYNELCNIIALNALDK
ncbi:MAG: D-alanine--D-alanine ligase [Eubacterium sp.]